MRLALTLLLAAAPLAAQTPLVEKIEVNVVNVDVTVTDHAGNPVPGLTKDNFEVFEDGVRQTITNFYAVERETAAATKLDERFRRKVLVIVDNLTTTGYFRDRALDRLERFISDRFSGGDYEWSLALVDRQAHLLLAPTSDKQQVFTAISEVRKLVSGDVSRLSSRLENSAERVTTNQPQDLTSSAAACNKQRLTGMLAAGDRLRLITSEANATAALAQAVRGFSHVVGKKTILFLTSDRALQGGFDPFEVNACMPLETEWDVVQAAERNRNLWGYLVQEANASNVSLYIINTEGWRPGFWESHDGPGVTAMSEVFVPPTDNGVLFWIANETGGRLLPGNDVAESLKTFDSVSSNFYSLGYRPARADDDKYHRIHLRLKRTGRFHLQYRDGYSSLPSREQLIRLLQSPLAPAMQPSTLPIEVVVESPLQNAKDVLLVPISVSLQTRDLALTPGPVEVFFSLFDSEGRNIAFARFDRQAERKGDRFVERHLLKVRKGKPYRLIIAVRDPLSDTIGIAQQAVKF